MTGGATARPALLLVAHGSRDPRAGTTVEAIAARVRDLRPGLVVLPSYLDHAGPRPGAVLAAHPGRFVVLPLLLADAFHASIDVQAVVDGAGGRAVSASVLGAAPQLLVIAQDLLDTSGVPRTAAVVLASAGTAQPEANAATAGHAQRLAQLRGAPVVAAFASAAQPGVEPAIAAMQDAGHQVGVLTWLLAPGRFADQVAASARAAGVPCTGVLGEHPGLSALVLARYDQAAPPQSDS